jgi:hypothetical protein
MDRQLWSIGHSTKAIDEFLALLQSRHQTPRRRANGSAFPPQSAV